MEFHVNQSPEAHYTVYKLTAPNGKMYIGCTGMPVRKRWQHSYRGKAFAADIKKYGWENIKKEIVCEKLLKDAAYELEKKLVEMLDTMNPAIGYNLRTGGEPKGSRLSPQSKESIKQAKLQYYYSDPSISLMRSELIRRQQMNKEVKEQQNSMLRKYYSIDANRNPQRSSKKPRPVRCITTGDVFPSIKSAAKAYKLYRFGISTACKNPGKYYNGLQWEFC